MTAIPYFPRLKEYVDTDGVRWRRRGEVVLQGRALARRLHKADLLVRHHCLGTITDVPVVDREQFWSSAEATMTESVHAEFLGVEFKDEGGRHLLVVDEHC